MTLMTSDESRESPRLARLTQLERDCVRRPTRVELDQGLNALYARIAADRVRRRVLVRWSMMACAAALFAVVILGVGALYRRHSGSAEPPALAYQIEGGSVLEGGYLRASGHTGMRLSFNEGTRFVLTPGTRGKFRDLEHGNASVAIENGTAECHVTPNSHRKWAVEAGPFLVTVKGTVFTVSWDPASERFELRLQRGRVVVNGPVSGGELALQAGQRLVVSLAEAETRITEDSSTESLDAAAPSAVVSVPASPSIAGERPAAPAPVALPVPSTVAKVGTEQRWAEDLARGRWDSILEDVERAGVEATLNGASSEALFIVANAARYRRRTDLARAALLAERRRFPDSPRALDATFLLGRVEESGGGGRAQALAWYDEYLARAPTGAFAAEALGRKMTVMTKAGDAAKARSIAEEYLRRFPKGSYAGSARAVLGAP